MLFLVVTKTFTLAGDYDTIIPDDDTKALFIEECTIEVQKIEEEVICENCYAGSIVVLVKGPEVPVDNVLEHFAQVTNKFTLPSFGTMTVSMCFFKLFQNSILTEGGENFIKSWFFLYFS